MSKPLISATPKTDFEKVLFLESYIKYLKIEHGKEISALHEKIDKIKAQKALELKVKEKKPRPEHLKHIDDLIKKNDILRREITYLNEKCFQLKKKYEAKV